MAYFKVLSLVLIFGCLAVLAENPQQQPNKADNQQQPSKAGDQARVISEQDVRLLFNPLISNILATKTTRAPRPVVVVPPYPYYPAHYPYYPHDHEHPTHPTKPTTKPTHTTKRPHYPNYPQYPHPPVYPYPGGYPHHPPVHPYYPPYGYPWYGSQYPPVVIVHPPITRPPSNGNGNGNGNDNGNGNGNDNNEDGNNADDGAGNDARYSLYPYADIENAPYENEEPPYDLVDDMSARNIKVDGISISSGHSDDDKDSFVVDTKDIKLPFGITLGGFNGISGSQDSSHKKQNEQEALIYLRNYKKGRQLRESKMA